MSDPVASLPTESPAADNKRERAKRERVDRIVLAARDLLREEPDGTVTLAQIAERAGLSAMTLFNLVGTRDDLWALLADRSLGDWQERASSIRDPRLRARRIVGEVAQVVVDNAAVFRALISSWADSGRVIEKEPTGALLECLRQAREDHQIASNVDLRRLASAIFSGLVGLVHQWAAALIEDAELVGRAEDLVDLVFSAGRPDGPPSKSLLISRSSGRTGGRQSPYSEPA